MPDSNKIIAAKTSPTALAYHLVSIFIGNNFIVNTNIILDPVIRDIVVANAAPGMPKSGMNKILRGMFVIAAMTDILKLKSGLPMPGRDPPMGWAIIPRITVPTSNSCKGRTA